MVAEVAPYILPLVVLGIGIQFVVLGFRELTSPRSRRLRERKRLALSQPVAIPGSDLIVAPKIKVFPLYDVRLGPAKAAPRPSNEGHVGPDGWWVED